MSIPGAGGSDSNGSLQFDKAEGTQPAAACAACGRPLADTYYEANGKVICPACRLRFLAEWNRGTGAGRFFKAALLGLLAGAVGAGIWYAILALTGYELGLVAIVVGLLVGGAVRKGSNGRGGWKYQALAIFITYSSIVVTYIPLILGELNELQVAGVVSDSTAQGSDSLLVQGAASEPPLAAVSDSSPPLPDIPPALGVVVGLAALFLLALALPVLAGLENIMGMIIIGIALYEAWRLNRRVELKIAGPYRVGGAPPAPSSR
jgi:hypothetical protein